MDDPIRCYFVSHYPMFTPRGEIVARVEDPIVTSVPLDFVPRKGMRIYLVVAPGREGWFTISSDGWIDVNGNLTFTVSV